MHSKGPSHFFKWPQREDMCWVPFEHILGIVGPPNSSQCGLKLFDNGEMVNVMFDVEQFIQKLKFLSKK